MTRLRELDGSRWSGAAELWLDPLGDSVQQSECTLTIVTNVVRYTWVYDGQPQQGSVELNGDGARFTDTWHQPEAMSCVLLSGAPGLFQVQGVYGPNADWGWRIALSLRQPSGELVLQMTNVAPWGEETRAVRMIAKHESGPRTS